MGDDLMDYDASTALRRDRDDEASRGSRPAPASRSAENEARIVAHLRAVLLGCGRSPIWG
jgi:hypothetical protein